MRKMAVVDYGKCRLELCDGGVCAAVAACPHHLLKQEATYTAPMPDPAICRGCGQCSLACPFKAIVLR
ncbi:MAG: 4Fe-4S binding protein [Chloroflexi bacterium]|nr:4Fe-4S binding protein [Chloroflexota bacterium]